MMEYVVGGAAFLIASHILKRNEAKIKGAIGEYRLSRKLKHLKLPGNKKILRDVLLPADWGSSQIDTIAITRYGIFVFEMKNYNAKVFGAVDGPDWKTVYEDGSIHKLLNPVRQNKSHVMALNHLLKDTFPNMNYIPLVIFSNKALLYVQNSRNKVCNLKNVHKVILRQLGNPTLTDSQVDEIASFLNRNMLKGRQARKNHVTAIDLRKETEQIYSSAYMSKVEQELRAQAAKKPIYSSQGIVSDHPEKPAIDIHDTRPLQEILKTAQSRTGTAEPKHKINRGDNFPR